MNTLRKGSPNLSLLTAHLLVVVGALVSLGKYVFLCLFFLLMSLLIFKAFARLSAFIAKSRDRDASEHQKASRIKPRPCSDESEPQLLYDAAGPTRLNRMGIRESQNQAMANPSGMSPRVCADGFAQALVYSWEVFGSFFR